MALSAIRVGALVGAGIIAPKQGGGGPQRILPPSTQFDWLDAALGIKVYRAADGAISHDYVPASKKPAITGITIYVDYAAGDNTANNGLTPAAPKKTLRGAISPINSADPTKVHRIVFKGGISPCAIAAQFSRSVVIESSDGGRLKHINVASETPIVWTKTAGRTNVYQGTPSAAVTGFVDVSASRPGYPADCPRYYKLTPVGDVATCDATPNSYFYDSANAIVYVNTFDSRAPDANVWQTATSIGLTLAAATGVDAPVFWADQLDCVGGNFGFTLSETFVTGGVAAYRAYLNRCTGQGGSQDGVKHAGLGMTLQYRFGAYDTTYDGLSSWGLNAASNTDPAGYRVEIECCADNCGSAGDGTTNSSTGHSMSRIVSINNDMRNAKDRNIHDINMCKRWWLGGTIGPSRTATGGSSRSLQAGNGADQVTETWVDGATFLPGSLYTLNTTALAAIRFRGAIPAGVTIDPASSGSIEVYA